MKKELPTVKFEQGNLFMLLYESIKWELLKTAIEFNLFDQTSSPVTAFDVSRALSLHPQNTEYMLNALVAIGCLLKTEGKFVNTEQTEQFLTSQKDTSLGQAMLFMEQWAIPVLNGGLRELVKNGPPQKENIAKPQIWEEAARVSLNLSRCGRAQQIAKYVSELTEFGSFRKIMDMGAGPGIIGIAVTAEHKTARCVIFDQEEVCNVAREVVAEYAMEDRVEIRSGDYMRDDFGKDYDFIMANFTLNFYWSRIDEIMCKVLDALKPGGFFMVTSDGVSKDKTAPTASIISWLSTMLLGNDMSLETGQIAREMLNAGFVSIEQKTLADVDVEAHGPVEMTIGRKW